MHGPTCITLTRVKQSNTPELRILEKDTLVSIGLNPSFQKHKGIQTFLFTFPANLPSLLTAAADFNTPWTRKHNKINDKHTGVIQTKDVIFTCLLGQDYTLKRKAKSSGTITIFLALEAKYSSIVQHYLTTVA